MGGEDFEPMGLPQRLLRPYVRRELPAWGKLYRLLGGERDERFANCGRGVVRGKLHGYEMDLDLGNWSERLTWFLGRYHDLALQQVLQRVLRPGDRFVDVGANLGMLSLLAASVVGDRGAVLACEPNPRMVARLREATARNGLTTVSVLHAALSDREGSVTLREFDGHAGWGSLSEAGPDGAEATASFDVEAVVGDQVLEASGCDRPMVIKVDVEGHEVAVLRGLRRTLARRSPLVFVEVVGEHLRRAGSSVEALHQEFERLGYLGYAIDAKRRWLRHAPVLRPLREREDDAVDALFVPVRGAMASRVEPILEATGR